MVTNSWIRRNAAIEWNGVARQKTTECMINLSCAALISTFSSSPVALSCSSCFPSLLSICETHLPFSPARSPNQLGCCDWEAIVDEQRQPYRTLVSNINFRASPPPSETTGKKRALPRAILPSNPIAQVKKAANISKYRRERKERKERKERRESSCNSPYYSFTSVLYFSVCNKPMICRLVHEVQFESPELRNRVHQTVFDPLAVPEPLILQLYCPCILTHWKVYSDLIWLGIKGVPSVLPSQVVSNNLFISHHVQYRSLPRRHYRKDQGTKFN